MKKIKILFSLSMNYTENLYKLQDFVIKKTEYENLCNIFTKYVDENKNESFL